MPKRKSGKFLAPKTRTQRSSRRFLLGMFLYAVIFLVLTAGGLAIFWDYMSYYESARPAWTMDRYLEQLDSGHVYDQADSLTSQLNSALEPESACRSTVSEMLSRGIFYAAREQQSSETEKVYALLCDGKTIGTVTLTQEAESKYGFQPWAVSAETFELSFLLQPSIRVTVPQGYTVQVNGVPLDDGFITASDVHYEVLEDFYEDFTLPTMNTYEAGPFLNQPEVVLLDAAGLPAAENEEAYLQNCSEAEQAELDEFSDAFITHYAAYTSSSSQNRSKNYRTVVGYVVPESQLAERLSGAFSGLVWGQTYNNTVTSITVNNRINVGSDRYFMDVTYVVDSVGKKGVVSVENHVKLIVLRTDNGLKAESLIVY